MEAHYKLTDSLLLKEMEQGNLDPRLFTHEAHLRWGWLLLKEYGLDQAIFKACSQLKRYTANLGASDKYNETVTVAAIRAIQHFQLKHNSDSFTEFISKAPRLKTSFKELLGFHYSKDIFKLNSAKSTFITPDLLPFD